MILMGPLPINSQTLGTPGKYFLLIKDIIRNLALCLVPWDFVEREVAEKASGKRGSSLEYLGVCLWRFYINPAAGRSYVPGSWGVAGNKYGCRWSSDWL
jgi:hypothetical protein